MKRSACVVAMGVAIVVLAASARTEIDGDLFSRDLFGQRVTLTTPKNWDPREDRSYPSVLLWMSRRDPPGRMLLSAEKLDGAVDSFDYAKRTVALLQSLGFSVRTPQLHASTGAYWIDFDDGEVYLRQAMLVVRDVGFVLTLSAPDSRTRGQHLRAFDFALRNIHIRRAPEAAPADAGPVDATPTP